jgi:hypothetical protein
MDQMTKPDKPWLWKPGQSGNPNGRPVGARTTFTQAFLKDLHALWAEHGKDAMLKTAKSQPEVFFGVCARLLPKDVELTISQQYPRGLDESDLAILRAIRAALPDANQRQPGEVLQLTFDALKAYLAKQSWMRHTNSGCQRDHPRR